MKNDRYNKMSARLKKQAKTYTTQKYKKLKGNCGPLLAYTAISSASLSCGDAKKLFNTSAGDISSGLVGSL